MASVFPFVSNAEPVKDKTSELPVFREYAYDFENNCLLTRAGSTYLVEKDEALKIWIYHALKVSRYIYTAHSKDYGNELDSLVGYVMDRETMESEIKRYITEALMVLPYIQELGNFSFSYDGRRTVVGFEVTSIYGRFTYESEIYNE